MSFWDYLFDSDWKQRSDIEELRMQSSLNRAHRKNSRRQIEKITSLENRVEELEDGLGEVILLLMATMEMLKQSKQWDEETFNKSVALIDAHDGTVDGKTSTKP